MGKSKVMIVFLCLAVFSVSAQNGFTWGGLKGEIQEELNSNPFLEKQKIKLRVTEEKNGYVTIDMYEGDRNIRDQIMDGTNVLKEYLGWILASQETKESVNILRETFDYIKKMEGVKGVLLTASLSTEELSELFVKGKQLEYSGKRKGGRSCRTCLTG